jgi:hypothetical protein
MLLQLSEHLDEMQPQSLQTSSPRKRADDPLAVMSTHKRTHTKVFLGFFEKRMLCPIMSVGDD